jgi:hypothetical protein
MQNLDEIFSAFGGPSKVGQAIGISTEHAASMKRRRSIPSGYWHVLTEAAKSRGIDLSLDALARIHARKLAS